MEEIIRAPEAAGTGACGAQPAPAEDPVKQPPGPGWLEKLRQGLSGQERTTSPLPPALFLALSAVVGAAGIVGTVYQPSYTVTADGVPLGAVSAPQVIESVIDRVEERASSILGYDYRLSQEIHWEFALTQRGGLADPAGMEDYLFAQIGEIMDGYVLRVNGELIGAAHEEAPLISMLDQVMEPYETENTVSSRLLAGVSITQEYAPAGVNQDVEEMRTLLSANSTEETTYAVQAGDTFMALAFDNGLGVEELEALNPDIDIDVLYVGQELVMQEEVPFVSVETVDRVTYQESVDPPVEKIPDDNRYEDEIEVVEPGSPGEALVTADVTYVNGREQSRTEVTREVLVEPVTRVVIAGTKERPFWYPKGYFIWPVHGVITSRFGYRNIFGSTSYHGGLDIAVPYGASVLAADGGTVMFAGTATGANWSYGNLVIIDHGNGKVTYYGHNSSVLVSAGDHVAQGQAIARAGSTGRSTGNHCHFEVRAGGIRVNPMDYLS